MSAPDDQGQATPGGRVLSGRVLTGGERVLRRPQLEELDRARRAVRDAQRQAEEIASAAVEAAEEARAQGYADGLAEARREAAEHAVRLRAEAVALRAEAGDRLLRLAVELARRVLHRELRLTPDALESLAREAVGQVRWCQRVSLRVHPADAEGLSRAHPRLAEALEPGAELTLTPDPSLDRGACLVETESGEVDASAVVQLAALEAALVAGSTPDSPADPGDRHE